MLLSIIVPCYNEEKTILQCIENINKISLEDINLKKEIIVIDDGSFDNSVNIIKELHRIGKISKFFIKTYNQGKGSAIKEGLKLCSGDFVLIQDSDLEYSPKDYQKLLIPILFLNADVVYGSRFLTTEAKRVLLFWHSLANKILTFFSNMFTNLNLTDMETGYKVFKIKCFKNLTLVENSFGFEAEITAKLAKKKYTFYEVGISYSGRDYSQGKKIGLKDAFRAVYCIIWYSIFN